MSVSVYLFHCISFRGQFFDVGRAISGRSRLLALVFAPPSHLVPSHAFPSDLVRSLPRSRSCVELLKTARVIIHPLPPPSHHLIHLNRSVLLPVFRHGWRGAFSLLCRFEAGAVRSFLPPVGL